MTDPKPRDVARAFCAGDTIGRLAFRYLVRPDVIEQCLRRHLERLLAKKNRKARKR